VTVRRLPAASPHRVAAPITGALDMKAHSTRAVANAIASYLAAHPASADTLEGIHGWWLGPLGFDHPVEVTACALELLEMEQKIESIGVGQRRVWRLRRDQA
jgi:hypothetical protein